MVDQRTNYIDTNEKLSEACNRLGHSAVLGVDTEFFRETTYFPIPALVQLYASDEVFLIDCLSIDSWQPLAQLMTNPSVAKILHSCSEDLEVFYQLLGVVPNSVIDTQIAAAIAGLGFSMGYQALVRQLLDIELDKEQTRSDWLRRPLSSAQLHYASNDVLWLPELWSRLSKLLESQGRLSWCLQDCERILIEPVPSILPGQQAYLRLKSAWRLKRLELNILRSLCAWREALAQERDVPRSRIFTDAAALELVRRMPHSTQQLNKIDNLSALVKDRYVEQILQLIAEAKSASPEDYPDQMADRSEPAYRKKLKALRGLVENQAKALQLPPEILGRRRELEKLIDAPESSEVMQGWRAELLAADIEKIMSAA